MSTTQNGKLKVLDVGAGPTSIAAQVFSNVEIEVTRMDANRKDKPDVLHDITKPYPERLLGQFDLVYSSHVLEHIDRIKVIDTVKHMASALRHGGELWIVVPSLEWAAEEIMRGNPSPALQGVLWGGQWNKFQYHKSGFTLVNLRQLMGIAGLIVRKAYRSPFVVGVGGEEFTALQNVCIGLKLNGVTEDVN